MKQRKRKPRLEADASLHPVAPPSSGITIDSRLKAIEDALGVAQRVTAIQLPHSMQPYNAVDRPRRKLRPGDKVDVVIQLRCLQTCCLPDLRPELEPNVPAPEELQ